MNNTTGSLGEKLNVNVLVTGVGGGVGDSILQALRLSGLSTKIVGVDMEPWGAGLYKSDKSYLVPPASETDYKEELLNICHKEDIDVIIPGSDPELSVLAEHRGFFKDEGFEIIVSDRKLVDICRDKLRTHSFFKDRGLPFADSLSADDYYKASGRLQFPLLVKPRGGSASRGICVVLNEKELEKYLGRAEDAVIQEYIIPSGWEGGRSNVLRDDIYSNGRLLQIEEVSTQVLVESSGDVIGIFTSKNVLKSGVPIRIEPFQSKAINGLVEEIVAQLTELGLRGPCNFQCKISSEGPIFFELNPRFTGITSVRAAMGFNEIEAAIRFFIKGESAESVQNILKTQSNLLCKRFSANQLFTKAQLKKLKVSGYLNLSDRTFYESG
ncbi:ATP-grasp domain-containing protein [Candidatus Bipolaricaulota bacterium]|nr:ATP-grasp domain-containing protein [Candidatus Bipolaricaulota bacterium]